MTSVSLRITGMSCDHCVSHVKKTLAAIPGTHIDAVAIGSARVSFDPAATTAEQLAAAVTEEGYPATVAA
jgi:copper chaperone CopZ